MARILVVVDYQNDFVTGNLGFEKAKELESGIIDKIIDFGKSGDYIIATMDTHDKDYMSTVEGKNLPIEHCVRGTEGWKIVEEVNEALRGCLARFIEKDTFGSIELANEIRRIEALETRLCGETPDTIEFCGVVTDICVLSNVIMAKAALPNARIIVHSNLCASNNDEMHEKALEIMRNIHVEVV